MVSSSSLFIKPGQFVHISVHYYRHIGTGEGRRWTQHWPRTREVAAVSRFALQLHRASTFICVLVCGCICPLCTSNSLPSLLITSVFHSLFLWLSLFLPKAKLSLTHTSESSTPPTPPPRGCHGDHRIQSELVWGSLSVCVCLYVTVPQANVLSAGQRSEPVTCLLSAHTWGRGCTHYCHSYALFRPRPNSHDSVGIPCAVVSIYWYVCVRVPQMGPRSLKLQPWMADKPSFKAELNRIITYITRPQVGYTEHHSSAFR